MWNHTFYWNCLSPNSKSKPEGDLLSAINKAFNSYDNFVKEFTDKATANFGSGWTWLVKNKNQELEIINTSNADTPVRQPNLTSLLTVDVWEHAYYIDYRNARPDYLKHFWELVNWSFVARNYS